MSDKNIFGVDLDNEAQISGEDAREQGNQDLTSALYNTSVNMNDPLSETNLEAPVSTTAIPVGSEYNKNDPALVEAGFSEVKEENIDVVEIDIPVPKAGNKSITFVVVLFVLIALFIIFLPQISIFIQTLF